MLNGDDGTLESSEDNSVQSSIVSVWNVTVCGAQIVGRKPRPAVGPGGLLFCFCYCYAMTMTMTLARNLTRVDISPWMRIAHLQMCVLVR
jgi:hypothetical protein